MTPVFQAFSKGLLVGLVLCAPLGPIGILAVRRTLLSGRMAGLLSLLGASTADGIYCAVAGLGVGCVSNFLTEEKELLRYLGGGVLVLVGIRVFFSQRFVKVPQRQAEGLREAFTSTLVLTLASPLPILVFSASLTALGVQGWQVDPVRTGGLMLGVFFGSALWAPLLVFGVGLFSKFYGPEHLSTVNRVSGGMILLFGLILLLLGLFS